jgi:hypothetical protein
VNYTIDPPSEDARHVPSVPNVTFNEATGWVSLSSTDIVPLVSRIVEIVEIIQNGHECTKFQALID